jgi:hypothetical protein
MLFIYIGLIVFGCYVIYRENDLAEFERKIFNKIRKMVKK